MLASRNLLVLSGCWACPPYWSVVRGCLFGRGREKAGGGGQAGFEFEEMGGALFQLAFHGS
jgi:hypothetical protein